MKHNLTNIKSFTITELMVVIFIITIVMAGGFSILGSGQSAWFTTEASITVEESLRRAINKVVTELSESGVDKNSMLQLSIRSGTGVGGSDVLKFSIPIVCQTGGSVIDSNGDVAYWGAPLTWGCTSSSCMDANNDCTTLEYKFVEYRLLNGNQLVRQVLDSVDNLIRQDLIANNIADFHATLSVDQKIVTLDLTAQTTSALNRLITVSKNINVRLRNIR